jgi:site-specific recombinase XerC
VQFEITQATRDALQAWIKQAGLRPEDFLRRTKATLIYRRTKNLRAVQLLLGHSNLEATVRYLGIEIDHALEISEQTEI